MSMSDSRRKWTNTLMQSLCVAAILIALIPLFLIFIHLMLKGFSSLNLSFFTELPKPVGESGGGMKNAIVGTLYLICIATAMALPIGISGGIYLSEFGRGKFGNVVRFSADMLNGTPSIVVGIFVYAMVVLPMGNFSALAGGVALGIIMLPMIMRTTEEMIKLVPHALREGSLALGIPYWRTLASVVLKEARGGILTGVLLSVARVSGETAPLLFTALGNQFWNLKLADPIAAMPLQIYTYAISPFDEWQRQAWAAALVLIFMVFTLSLLARIGLAQKRVKRR